MKSYITQVSSINKTSFNKRDFSLSGKDYRQLKVCTSSKPLSSLIEKSYQGKEIGSDSYMKRSKYRFLKTVNLTDNFGISEESIEYCRPKNIAHPQLGDILIAKDGGGDGLGESALYNLQNADKTDSISAGVLGLRIKKEDKYYLLGFLKSKHFRNFVDLNTPQGSTIRHSKKVSLNYPVPTPKDEKIENLVSLITQNILDKEEQIKLKNKKIDELIEKELKENQKSGTFEFRLPKISEMKKKEFRIDSRIYERKLQQILFQIRNYINGSNTINQLGFKIKRGQNLQITCIGESYYSTYRKSKLFYPLITSTNINFSRQITSIRFIGSKKKLIKIKENDIMIAATGVNTGKVYVFPEVVPDSVSNINSFFLNTDNKLLSIFTGLFLSYLSKFDFCKLIGSKSNGGSILDKDVNEFTIPKFPESKQKEIAKEYYNPTEKSSNLNFDNYLEKEKARNAEAGIFQLNMELFSLREKLEDFVDKIVKEEKIIVSFEY